MEQQLNTFLYYGTTFDVDAAAPFLQQLASMLETVKLHRQINSYAQHLAHGIGAWEASFVAADPTKTHIVPLSGGLDSRAILAALLKYVPRQQIHTFTYGTSRTWDMKFARQVATKAGVRHDAISLPDLAVTTADLVAFLRQTEHWTPALHSYYNHLVYQHSGADCVYWSGHMGNVLSGSSRYTKYGAVTWAEATRLFARKNQFTRSTLHHPDFKPTAALPQEPLLDTHILLNTAQLDFGYSENQYLRKIMISDQHDVRTPFLSSDWVRYIFSTPTELLEQRQFVMKLLEYGYPTLFAIPTSSNYGLPVGVRGFRRKLREKYFRWRDKSYMRKKWLPPLDVNYLRLRSEMDQRKWLYKLFRENLLDLEQRNVVSWLNVIDLWERFYTQGEPLEEAIHLLLSLELHLKAGRNLDNTARA
jgi:asparagine synthetase B (glutamine-hydrolysing)